MKIFGYYPIKTLLILLLFITQISIGSNCKNFKKNVSIKKLLSTYQLLVKTCAIICGNLTVNGKSVFNGNIIFNGGNTSFAGDLTVDKNLIVKGNTTLQQDLTVDGDTNLHGDLTVDENLIVKGDTTLQQDLTVDGDTNLHGDLTVDENLIVKGDTTLQQDLTVDGDTNLHGDLTVDENLIVKGDTTLQQDLTVDGDLTVNGNFNFKLFGNVVRVDKLLGDDATGERNGAPFLTINAALAAAQPYDMIWIFPGIYDETITIPDNIAIVGTERAVVIIRQTNVIADTDLVTMGENSSLESVTLQLDSIEHHQLRGIVLSGTTSKTTQVRDVNIIIDNSSAPIGGSSNVYGIISNGTGFPDNTEVCICLTTINVRSIGNGTTRGILVNTANGLFIRDSDIIAVGMGGSGSFIGAETSNASALLQLNFCTIAGTDADISQTLGSITLADTHLENFEANSFGFSTTSYPSNIIFADIGALENGTRYMRPGSATTSGDEIFIRLAQTALIKSLAVNSRIAGNTNPDTWTLNVNGVNTALNVTLTGTSLFSKNDSISVKIDDTDSISLEVINGAGNPNRQDTIAIIEIY